MNIRKCLATMATVSAGLTLCTAGLAGTAHAAPPLNPNYGFDGNAHIIVSGGSDTTYKAMTAIAALYDTASIGGCTEQTSATLTAPFSNQCLDANSAPGASGPVANYDRDTVVNAAPSGSSAGIASLNGSNGTASGTYTYQGTATGTVDFARSSRAANIGTSSPGDCAGGNELTCDTFWGFAEDGVEVFGFGSTHSGINITPAQLTGIYNCSITTWGQIDGNSSDTAPIVPWGMNTASGTYATFNSFLISNGGAPAGFTVDQHLSAAGSAYPSAPTQCVRQLTSSKLPPFENDVKPLFADVEQNPGTGNPAFGTGVNDPNNWIWFGSFGLLSAFPYDNTYSSTVNGQSYLGVADKVQSPGGSFVPPNSSTILAQTYPIDRTLYHVTKKADADCPKPDGTDCDLTGGPTEGSVTDANVLGGKSGNSGAVREFTRFLCRISGQDPVDPYSGTNLYTEVQAARAASGFTAVPGSIKTPGSSCQVSS